MDITNENPDIEAGVQGREYSPPHVQNILQPIITDEERAIIRNQIVQALKIDYCRSQIGLPPERCTPIQDQYYKIMGDLIEQEMEHLKVQDQSEKKKKPKPKKNGYKRQDWIEILDLFFKLNFGLIFISLIGASVTAALQYSVDGRDKCDAGPTQVRNMITEGGYSLIAFAFSGFFIVMTNVVGRAFKTKECKRIRNWIFLIGFLLTAAVSVVGIYYVSLCLADLFQVRLGLRECGAAEATTMSRYAWALGVVGGLFYVVAGVYGFFMGFN